MNDVEIYPSSWYYNACVQGFLEILAWGLGKDGQQQVEEMLQDDGRAVIPHELMEAVFSTNDTPAPSGYSLIDSQIPELKRIGWWWVEKSKKNSSDSPEDDMNSACLSMFGTNQTFYPNLLPHNDKMPRDEFLNSWFAFETGGKLHCSFCNSLCQPDETMKDKYNYFSLELSKLLGSAKDRFPNYFWNNSPSLLICKNCRSYFLFFHIVHQNRFFVNSDSLKVNWHINHLLSGQINKGDWQQQTLMNALHYDTQFRKAVGSWGLQRLEVVIFEREKKKEKLNCYPISANLAKLFLIPSISSLTGRISNRTVWDTLLKERFDYLLTIIYKSLRVFLADKTNVKDPEIIEGWSSKGRDITPITQTIELYHEIRKYQRGGKSVSYIKYSDLRNEAVQAPINLANNKGKNLVFRLLELTRMNKRSNVYHLLLRVYITNGKPFPKNLSRLFEIEDSELFKNGIYAFVSGLKNSEQNDN